MLSYKGLIIVNKELLIKIRNLKNQSINQLIKEREELEYVINKRKK